MRFCIWQRILKITLKIHSTLPLEEVEAFEEVIFSKIEIMCTIIQRLSGRTNRYTLQTFSRRMFYLSNASERRDEDRKEGGTYVRTQWFMGATPDGILFAFASAALLRWQAVPPFFASFLLLAPLVMPRSLRTPSRFPAANKSR